MIMLLNFGYMFNSKVTKNYRLQRRDYMSLKDYLDDRRKARERELRLETRKRQMKSAKNIAVGTILGSLAGVTAGILFAPKSGEETRKDIDRKSTRLNSSHVSISYAVFCLKKKNKDRR